MIEFEEKWLMKFYDDLNSPGIKICSPDALALVLFYDDLNSPGIKIGELTDKRFASFMMT